MLPPASGIQNALGWAENDAIVSVAIVWGVICIKMLHHTPYFCIILTPPTRVLYSRVTRYVYVSTTSHGVCALTLLTQCVHETRPSQG